MIRQEVALRALARVLDGEGFDALKPLAARDCKALADLAWAAIDNTPHEQLDRWTAASMRLEKGEISGKAS